MVSRTDAAVRITRQALPLALVSVVATVLSLDDLARTMAAGPGTGVAFPFPTGLPTLWTYVAVPGGPVAGGSRSPLAGLPVLVLALLLTAALAAGFLGTLDDRVTGTDGGFVANVAQYTVPMVGVNLVRFAVVLVALPLLFLGPLVLVVVVALSYLVYGLPFVVVVEDCGVGAALTRTVALARAGGHYASFGVVPLVLGAAASAVLTTLVRNLGFVTVVPAALLVAVPALFVATYGLLVVRELTGSEPATPGTGNRSDD